MAALPGAAAGATLGRSTAGRFRFVFRQTCCREPSCAAAFPFRTEGIAGGGGVLGRNDQVSLADLQGQVQRLGQPRTHGGPRHEPIDHHFDVMPHLSVQLQLVGGLGRLVPERGFQSLVESMAAVWATFPETLLAIGGEGPERSALEAIAKASHRPDQIRFMGPLDDAWEFLSALDLFVVPSIRAGFSMAALEAMALGIPTMVRSTGGLVELVEPDISGFVYRADEELGAHIVEVLDLPLTLQTVGAAGRIRATETFALEPSVEGLVEIYRNILSGD